MPLVSHYERRQNYLFVERVLRSFERNDQALARMAEMARADGFPSGHGSGGSSKGEHSDPTCGATVARVDGTDDASRAFAKFEEAVVVLKEANRLLRRALPPETAGLGLVGAETQPDTARAPADAWCTSCARVRHADGTQAVFTERTRRRGHRKDLCDWCEGEWMGNGKRRSLPDLRLVMAHHAGARLTDARRREVLAMGTDDARRLFVDARGEVGSKVGA